MSNCKNCVKLRAALEDAKARTAGMQYQWLMLQIAVEDSDDPRSIKMREKMEEIDAKAGRNFKGMYK